MRLNKFMARAGVASRRKSDALIERGVVTVNGQPAEIGQQVQKSDDVRVHGKKITLLDKVYILLNKPDDTITTTDDERGRQTVMDLVQSLPDDELSGLFPVGRLDRDTLGVLLLTTDGDLAHRLMHPSYEIEKLYYVKVQQPVTDEQLDQLRRGVELEDGMAQADRAEYLDEGDKRLVGLSLHEGRNRQIRRMFEAMGHLVIQLERVRYAGLTTKGVRPGRWRRLEDHEARRLRRSVGLS